MKNRFAAAIAAAAFSATPTFAADMPMKAPVMAAYDWTGFYLGVNAGVGLGRNLTVYDAVDSGAISYLNPLGAVGGVQAGYNWQANWVLGFETDIQGASMRDTPLLPCLLAWEFCWNSIRSWIGSARHALALASLQVRC